MAKFTTGNQFWKLRSTHGRDKLFKSPQLLWEAATEYFNWTDENPMLEVDFVGKDANEVEKPHHRPYTLVGLALYFDCSISWIKEFESRQKELNTPESIDFLTVLSRIRQIIYKNKFDGASCGFFNQNIIARDLGLIDKTDISASIDDKRKTVADLFPTELKIENE